MYTSSTIRKSNKLCAQKNPHKQIKFDIKHGIADAVLFTFFYLNRKDPSNLLTFCLPPFEFKLSTHKQANEF